MSVKNKIITGTLFGAPPATGTLTGLIAVKLGVPVDLVLLGAAALTQGLQVLVSIIHRERKARARSGP